MSKGNPVPHQRAVILTALPAEFNAVRAHLTDIREEIHKGTVYERGLFSAGEQAWEVGIVEVGAGNHSAASEAERAITHFDPTVALFVGVAGGVKDVEVGDVVAATKVYGYESGKAEQTFKSRPDVRNSSHGMVHRARAEARKPDWLKRIIGVVAEGSPRAFVGPIAAGEKVIAATESELYQFIRSTYNDTLAIEMEGRGFLEAAHAHPQVMALIVRGISDLIHNKSDLDDAWRQEIAVRHASAFAFEVLAKLEGGVNEAANVATVIHPPPIPTAINLEPISGAVPLNSPFYIERPNDQELMDAIKRSDSFVLIKGARQMGKTSLLARGLHMARDMGTCVVITDLQKLNAEHLTSTTSLLQALGGVIAYKLNLDRYPKDVWSPQQGPNMNFEHYLRSEVLGKINGTLVWALDEVDRLFGCPFADEVFGLFRSWHNERSLDPQAPWQRMTIAMTYATEAHLFIKDQNQSPFNVGTPLTMKDFTREEEIPELNRRYGEPLRNSVELDAFYRLVGGHPYLTRYALNEMVSHELPYAVFERQAGDDDGPFGDHLRHFLKFLIKDALLRDTMRNLIRGQAQPSNEAFYRLRSAGLVSGRTTQDARPRCQLYVDFFMRYLM